MENPFETSENTPKRSTLLTVLAVLTFIGSGFSLIGNLYTSLGFQTIVEMIDDAANDDALASWSAMFETSMETMEKAGPSYFGFFALFAALNIIGAALMLKLKKVGFHIYATSQIIALFIPMFYGLVKFPDVFGTLITALFIWLYARELKIFGK